MTQVTVINKAQDMDRERREIEMQSLANLIGNRVSEVVIGAINRAM
jgi:hypothetical protein